MTSRTPARSPKRLQANPPPTPVRPEAAAPRLLRLPQVLAATGLSRAYVYERMKEGTFPRARALSPVKRGGSGSSAAVAWLEADVTAWILSLPEVPAGARRGARS